MSTTADDSPADAPAQQHAGLRDLFDYSLMAALQDRRTRRVAQGQSLTHGALSYESPNAPSPVRSTSPTARPSWGRCSSR